MTSAPVPVEDSGRPVIVLSGVKVRSGMHEQERAASEELDAVLAAMPGFISAKKYVAEDGEVLSVFRFETEQDVIRWRDESTHVGYQKVTDDYYESFWVQTAQVYRAYRWQDGDRHGLPADPSLRPAP